MPEFDINEIKLIVGLGNPGVEYLTTRHNAGAMLLEYIRKHFKLPEFKFDKYTNAMLSKGSSSLRLPAIALATAGGRQQADRSNPITIYRRLLRLASGDGSQRQKTTQNEPTVPVPCTLVFPQTFMNNSGKSVKHIMDKENIQPDQLLVLHDEKDINFGEIRRQKEISSAGHKGVQSIIDSLGTNSFWRLRIGIGPVPEPLTTDVFVLQKFTQEETEKLPDIFGQATKIISNF